jgi:hypothetical protein
VKHWYAAAILLMLPPPAVEAALPNAPDTLWAVTYDAGDIEKAYKARPTCDGGYIICGSTRSPGPGDTDAYVIKTGPAGDVTWSEHYGGSYTEEVYDIQQTADGGYIAVGYTSTNTAGYFDVYFLRLDAAGDTLWTKTYGGIDYDYGYSVAETLDGGFIIAGRTSSFGKGWRSAYFIRTDAGGDTLWTRAHGGWGKDEAYSVAALPGGGYAAAGYTESYGAGESDVWLIRMDAAGDTLWTRTYGGGLDERAEDLRQTPDRGFIMAGRTNSFAPPYHDMYVVRVDAGGDTLWTRTYGGAAAEHAYSVSTTLDGGFITAGYTQSYGTIGTNVFLVRCDADGDTLWTKTIGGTGSDCAYSAEQISGGGYMVSGFTFSMGTGDGDAFLVALAPSGGCPQIQEIADVPSDDEGYVDITWLPSFYDNPALEGGIRRYKIWRRITEPAISLGANAAEINEIVRRPAGRYELTEQGALYKLVGQVPAVADSIYALRVQTDCGPLHARRCEGCFFVSAHTGTLGERFESPVMCGYSRDDLAAPDGAVADRHGERGPAAFLRTVGPSAGGSGWRIEFAVAEDGDAAVEVFSVTGRKVATLLYEFLEAGEHAVNADRTAYHLGRLAPGTYFVRLRTGSLSRSAKLVILR